MDLAIIMAWYVGIGALCAVGATYLSHRFVPAKHEATLYGLCLIPVAAVYLAFTSHFGEPAAVWHLETVAVLAFAALGCLGTRVPVALMAGYALHGGWDLMHEMQAHLRMDPFGGRESTIPLAYGAFCATFDWAMVVYFLYRRRDWQAA